MGVTLTPPGTVSMIKKPHMHPLTRVLFFPVCIPDLDITSALVALSSISSRMYRVGFLNTIIVGGTLLTVLGKLVRPQFGLSEGIF